MNEIELLLKTLDGDCEAMLKSLLDKTKNISNSVVRGYIYEFLMALQLFFKNNNEPALLQNILRTFFLHCMLKFP